MGRSDNEDEEVESEVVVDWDDDENEPNNRDLYQDLEIVGGLWSHLEEHLPQHRPEEVTFIEETNSNTLKEILYLRSKRKRKNIKIYNPSPPS